MSQIKLTSVRKYSSHLLNIILGNNDLFVHFKLKPLTIYLSTDCLTSLTEIFKRSDLRGTKSDKGDAHEGSESLSIKEYEDFISCIEFHPKPPDASTPLKYNILMVFLK